MDKAKITPNDDGPYHIEGPFTLVTPAGKEIPFKGDQVWLCRCGHSAKKPFCDGSHKKAGFQSKVG